VAARRGEEALAAAVYAPLLREIYTATAAGPALCNGLPLRVSAVSDLGSAVVHTGLDRQDGVGGASFPVFQAVARAAQRPRVLGSAALDICRVAAGQADAYVETGVYVWDVAAAGLIVRRAGGRGEVLAWRDAKRRRLSYLASNGLIHSALRDLIVPFLPGSAGLAAATAP
jgi:myo-inositol-1(or 4)-monophosphatase